MQKIRYYIVIEFFAEKKIHAKFTKVFPQSH